VPAPSGPASRPVEGRQAKEALGLLPA
jgi:hypothetical protein